jgi:glycosyltransferase involved in cell wall biosynthesis
MFEKTSEQQIAIVCDKIPYPPRSGDSTRISELISVLRAKGWFVRLVLTVPADSKSLALCRENADAVHVFLGTGAKARLRNILRLVVRSLDGIGRRLGISPLERYIHQLVGEDIDSKLRDYWLRYPRGLDDYMCELDMRCLLKILIVEYIWLYRAREKVRPSVVKILDTHDIQHVRAKEYASRGETFPLRIDIDREASIFIQFDAVIAIQKADAALIREMCPDLRVLTVGCSTIHKARCSGATPVPWRVLYIGGCNTANIDGLKSFLEECWPRILDRHPDAQFRICGDIFRAFSTNSYNSTHFTGPVDDLTSEYHQAEIVVNPIWIGTGLKIKTVEALAHGKAVVTTPKGIEGMAGNISDVCVVAANREEFINAVILLLEDKELARQVAAKASLYTGEFLSREAVYGELLNFLDTIP